MLIRIDRGPTQVNTQFVVYFPTSIEDSEEIFYSKLVFLPEMLKYILLSKSESSCLSTNGEVISFNE